MDTRLQALGLDEKEQRFYLAALELGTAPVTAIAARADVSRTNGYDLVQRLQKRGLLSQIEGEGGVRQVVAEDPSVLMGCAYHGCGVSIGAETGAQLARLAAGLDTPALPGFMRRPPPRFPLPGLRPLYLAGALTAYALKDRLS